jgi:hypothetical protein
MEAQRKSAVGTPNTPIQGQAQPSKSTQTITKTVTLIFLRFICFCLSIFCWVLCFKKKIEKIKKRRIKKEEVEKIGARIVKNIYQEQEIEREIRKKNRGRRTERVVRRERNNC